MHSRNPLHRGIIIVIKKEKMTLVILMILVAILYIEG